MGFYSISDIWYFANTTTIAILSILLISTTAIYGIIKSDLFRPIETVGSKIHITEGTHIYWAD